MAASSISLSSISFFRLPYYHHHHHLLQHQHHPFLSSPHQIHLLRTFPTLQASRRSSSQNDDLINNSRKWSRFDFDGYEEEDDDEDDEEDEEEDRSLDLLIRFVENIFRKVSKRARKAVRSVLPVAISTKLVGFAVNGLIILSFLWVLKAFLEVICTLGSAVFGGNTGFSIGAVKKANLVSLVIGPGAGYNLKSNPLPKEEATAGNSRETKKHTMFQERQRAEQESFRAVFDRRRHRIGGLDPEED